jgi:hypothetical protein
MKTLTFIYNQIKSELMPNKDTEFEKHPAVLFLKKFIASISASIKEHSLKDSVYSLTLTTVTGAGRFKSFLEEKVIQYDYDRTYFLISLDSIPQEFLTKTTKDTKESPRDILVNLLRNNGLEPKPLSSKNLLGNEVRLSGNNGVVRLDFFKKDHANVIIPLIQEAGFETKSSPNNDPCCYLITLESSVAIISSSEVRFTPVFMKKFLEDNKLPTASSFGAEKRSGYPKKIRGIYFKTPKDRDIVFNFLVKKFPDSEFLSLSERTILINDPNMLTRGTRTKTAKPAIAKVIPIKSTPKKVITVPQVKVSKTVTIKAFTPEIPFFMEEFKELLVRYNILPKVEQPAGVLIPDSIGDEIVLPHEALVKTGANGIIISTKVLRDYFKKIK